MDHCIIYGLMVIAAVAYFAVFGFAGFAAWDWLKRMLKKKKEKGCSEAEK